MSAEPTLVYHRGFLEGAMRTQRVTAEELRQAARGEGHADLEEIVGDRAGERRQLQRPRGRAVPGRRCVVDG